MADSSSLARAVKISEPDEVYNLAAQSFVKSSFAQPELTGDVTGMGTTRLLEAVRFFAPTTRFYQASTSEMFGTQPPPHNERTQFYPRSPYAAAKLYAHWMTINYREAYGIYASCGILYNHESARRGSEFVTQKIAQGVAAIKLGARKSITLGNLEARRDWGHAKDYVRAMWMMLQNPEPDDYVVATGESHSVKEFVEAAFGRVGLDWSKYVEFDEKNLRPTEVPDLRGDCTKIKSKLGWVPTVTFTQLVEEMVDHALAHPEEWPKEE
jgi:GDPmannose 4,6-dehydratase